MKAAKQEAAVRQGKMVLAWVCGCGNNHFYAAAPSEHLKEQGFPHGALLCTECDSWQVGFEIQDKR